MIRAGAAGTAEIVERLRAMRDEGMTTRQIQAALPGIKVTRLIRQHNIPVTRRRPSLPGETWRAVPGYEDRYEVSDRGRVWSVWNPEFPRSGVLMKPCPVPKGYFEVTIWRDRESRHIGIHRLVAWAFIGPQQQGVHVRHLDGNPSNNRLSNLAYGTPSENNLDKVRHGTDHNSSKTHCIAGHPYDSENTYVRPRGGRTCRECKRQKWHRDADRINARRRAA